MEKYKRLSNSQITALALTMIMAGGGAYGVMSAANSASAQTPATQSATNTRNDNNEPSLNGSIKVGSGVKDESLSEADESAQYAGLATITADEARVVAEKETGGTVTDVQLGNENGSLVYEVHVGVTEVKVDAGNGTVLATDSGDANEGPEGTEVNEGPEGAEGPKGAETDGIDHQFEGEENHTD